jgi:hypothetical protein
MPQQGVPAAAAGWKLCNTCRVHPPRCTMDALAGRPRMRPWGGWWRVTSSPTPPIPMQPPSRQAPNPLAAPCRRRPPPNPLSPQLPRRPRLRGGCQHPNLLHRSQVAAQLVASLPQRQFPSHSQALCHPRATWASSASPTACIGECAAVLLACIGAAQAAQAAVARHAHTHTHRQVGKRAGWGATG